MTSKKIKRSVATSRLGLLEDLRILLAEGKVTTQEDICDTLNSLGHTVNQSKVSRLLRKIGAVKSNNEQGQIVYRLPREPAPPTIYSELSSLIIDVVANEVTIIVYTSPGAAQVVARILDFHKNALQILATIAGDDSIFIAPNSIKTIQESVKAIRKLLFS